MAVVLAVGAGLLLATAADARVGGGQSFSGGGSDGGGSAPVDGDLIALLLWLCLEYPHIGVPLTIMAVAAYTLRQARERRDPARPIRSHAPGPSRQGVDLGFLRADDPNFSLPLFLDFAQLAYTRVQEQRGRGELGPLRPLVSRRVREEIGAAGEGVDAVGDVIFGATRLVSAHRARNGNRLEVRFTTNLTEVRGGRSRHLLREERWTFFRKPGVLSPGPERMRALGCTQCGSTAEPGADGRCVSCGSFRLRGEAQWEVRRIDVVASRSLSRPEVHLGGGVEPATRWPTVKHPDLPARKRAFTARHPAFDWAAFQARVTHVFQALQAAWSDGDWARARPYETDALFDVHRFWMDRYARFGLANRLTEVEILEWDVADVDLDAWYESVTVRIWARMYDWTEELDSQKVIGGSKEEKRTFSEYWTFIRAVGSESRGAGPKDGRHCPSCGAPLDEVGMSGICGYCDTKITGGDFDWVLSRIEQDDVYGF